MFPKRSKPISNRQVQKRTRAEIDTLLANVVDPDSIFGENVNTPDDVSDLESSTGVDINSVNASNEDTILNEIPTNSNPENAAGPSSSIIVQPTRLDLFSSEEESETVSSSDNEGTAEGKSLGVHLREFYVESKVNLTQLGLLLSKLRLFHPELPCDPRTIVKTPRSTNVKQLANGTYVHIGLKSGLVRRLEFGTVGNVKTLKVDMGFDGLPLSKSTEVHCWPIMARSFNLKDCRPFVVGVFCGSGHPEPLREYLADYMSEAKQLLLGGIDFDSVNYRVVIHCYICDAPARAYLKCIKGHSGHSGCERCVDEGEYVYNRMVFEPQVSALRTEEAFLSQDDEEHHHSVSPLTELDTKFISMFVLDPMHLLLIGSLKRFLQFLLGKCKTNTRLSAKQINDISKKLLSLGSSVPREFSRKPSSLEFLSRWKATQLRLFLLYLSIIALKGNVPDEIYDLFLMLHVASRIISSPSLVKLPDYVNFAEELLHKFVKHCAHKTVFGFVFVVYNTHSLLHLIQDVRLYGDISKFSAFPFENLLGIIKRLLRSGVKVAQQIAHRLAEMECVSEPPSPPTTTLTPNGLIGDSEFRFLSCSYFTLTPYVTCDSYFSTNTGLGKLKKITQLPNGSIQILADICDNLEDYYKTPIESSEVGIYKFDAWTNSDVILDPSEVTGKFMVINDDSENVAMRLLHTS